MLFLFSVASLFCLRIVIAAKSMEVVYKPSTIVLKPGLEYPVTVWFLTTDNLHREVKLMLDGADDVCLSVNANDNTSRCEVAKCSTTCTFFEVVGQRREFSMTYSADKNSLVIPSKKSLTMKVESNPPVLDESKEYSFTAQDGRKVVVGFADSLHRLVAEDPLELPIVRYGNKSLSIDKNLTIAVTLWQSDDGENWKEPKSLPNINEKLTNSSSWTVIVDDLNKDLFYKVDLTTSLSDVVELQPSVVKIYPTLPKLKCGRLADNVRDLVRNHRVNETVVDNILDQMCRLVNESKSTQIDTTSTTTESPTEESTTTSDSTTEGSTATTNSTTEGSTATTNSTAEVSTATTNSTEVSTTTTDSIAEVSTATTDSTAEESTTTTDSTAEESTTTAENSQDEESTSDNTTVEDVGSSMLWFAFLGLVAVMLAVGVSGYLLFNHHAKVKVYLFQLVGKSGSSLSPSTGRRGKSGAAKYTPLPTNVRETMLHQD